MQDRAAVNALCPRCSQVGRMLPIVFGYPSPETLSAVGRGEIQLGGCVVSGEDPTHHCTACDEDVLLDDDPPLVCIVCGRPLVGDPEDEPTGESERPICGDCNRARNFDADLEAAGFVFNGGPDLGFGEA